MTLVASDFSSFFEEIYGYGPFPWQSRLLGQLAEKSEWPSVLDLPTGAGKTAVIDIAIFHLALEADLEEMRRAPLRVAFVVDRRLVVDDAYGRAKQLAMALEAPPGPTVANVAERLKRFSGDGPPVIARRLRGGIPREDDWARTPVQPTVLCSTVDQIGSRLLFRGYGVSDSMKPVHAGLIGADCLIFLDEAHLAEPFRQTLKWVDVYKGKDWREVSGFSPWGVTFLSATPATHQVNRFTLDDKDRCHSILKARLGASKPTRLITLENATEKSNNASGSTEDKTSFNADLTYRAKAIAELVEGALQHLSVGEHGVPVPVIGVVVNRVARARTVFQKLLETLGTETVDILLLIGPTRATDRDDIASLLTSIRTGKMRAIEKPLILVATQCMEAGVDIDLDALITEAAPLDSLRQRFGRLNRAGRDIVPYAAIIAAAHEISAVFDDPVYGRAIKPTWDRLMQSAVNDGNHSWVVEFGIDAFSVPIDAEVLSPKVDAPVLLPAHVDLLTHTSPVPAADPEVALYLHGPSRQPDSINVIWRADIEPSTDAPEDVRRLLMLVPPRSSEAVELPLWAVLRWLSDRNKGLEQLSDVAGVAPEEDKFRCLESESRRVFRWRGNDERSCWIQPRELHPGDCVIVPARFGGVDQFGWNPNWKERAEDVGFKAAMPFSGRRLIVRIAPGLLGESVTGEMLAAALAGAESRHWRDLRAVLMGLDLPELILQGLQYLDHARRGRVLVELDLYGTDKEGRPRGVIFVAPLGINGGREEEEGYSHSTEDDLAGSIALLPLSLEQHSLDVEKKAETFARAAGLSRRQVNDLKLAGYFHDSGKLDPRFQAWLHYGDPLGPDPGDSTAVLAKSNRPVPLTARASSGLPNKWRHEALSVRLATVTPRLTEADDPELVLWLIGVHHGYGRPFFPHQDPEDDKSRKLAGTLDFPTELAVGPGPQSLAFDWQGHDWAALFSRLKARYGIWELARMEAILRLADHRASQDRSVRGGGNDRRPVSPS